MHSINSVFSIRLDKIALKYIPCGVIDRPALIQLMTWRQTGDKPLCEPMNIYQDQDAWHYVALLGPISINYKRQTNLGLHSLSGRTAYHKMSRNCDIQV